MANLFTSDPENISDWLSLNSVTTDLNAIDAPDGTTTADRYQDDGVGSPIFQCIYESATLSAETDYIFQCFFKAADHGKVFIGNNAMSSNGGAYFDLSTATAEASNGPWSNEKIEDFGDGWYLCSAVCNVGTSGDRTGNLLFGPYETAPTQTAAQDGTSNFYLWGMYYDVGSSPVTYVSNAGIPVTRGELAFIRSLPRDLQHNLVSDLVK